MADRALRKNGVTGCGVGAALPRREDERFLRGRAQYVGDIRLERMRDVAFVRSSVAHAIIEGFSIPPERRGNVFTADDLAGVEPIRAISGLPGFKASAQPVLARNKVRYVGELIAACVADTRAEAEDLADAVRVDFQVLPAVVDMLEARRADAPLVHDAWGDNMFLESHVPADVEAVAARAEIVVSKEIRTARQCMSPMEGRGVVAYWDRRLDELVVYSSCQMPHVVRAGLAQSLRMSQSKIRVISPDVGGGFGYKCILLPEEVCLSWLALRLGHPVRWIEDRREQLTAGANCREHHYRIKAYADKKGRILALDAEATVDSGAYSVYPFTACLEAGQLPSMLPGPYRIPTYRCKTYAVASNKPPLVPYRGVARPNACLALELIVDAVALASGLEPYEVRLENLVPPEAMPFENVTGKHFDSGRYPECLLRLIAAIDLDAVRARQQKGESDGRLIGLGISFFNEQSAVGTSVYAAWGIPMVPGHEPAIARLTPDGVLELSVGVHSHGQGMETTLAQIAHEVLGLSLGQIKIVYGDTAVTPYSTGTWGSRSTVMAGGAVARACRALAGRVAKIGAHLLQSAEKDVRVAEGKVMAGTGAISIAEVADVWYSRPQDLPPDIDPSGLQVNAGYKPTRDSGVFSYSAHAAVVAVDPELGRVEILDYALVEDGGVLVNPMIVDGQVLGGTAQGIGSALYEEMPFDEQGQPLASTLADYLLPGAREIPVVRIEHMQTPSPYTEFGVKGIGEGGCIGPPAAILNAVNDALRPIGAELSQCPITPARVRAAIAAARQSSRKQS
jgi:aerobic carbon-monoxide dehydrogenase large subunit